MTDYKQLYERIQKGEKAITIALEIGKSVTALYKHFDEENLLEKNREKYSEETWKEYYNFYKKGMSITDIKTELNVNASSIYNQFAKFGYERKSRSKTNKKEVFDLYKEGKTIAEIAFKLKRSYAYIRQIVKIAEELDQS